MYSLSIRFKNLDAFERIRIPFGYKSVTITSNNRQYIQPLNGIKSVTIEFAIGGASKVMHYSCYTKHISVTYGVRVNLIKDAGELFYNFYIQNDNGTNIYTSDVIINYNVSYVVGDTTYFSNNQMMVIPTGSNAVGVTINNSRGITKAILTIISITPTNFKYTTLNEAYF